MRSAARGSKPSSRAPPAPGLYDLWSLLLWPFVEVLLATDDTLKMRAGMNCWYENWEMEVTVKGDVHQEAEDWNLLIFSQQKRCLHWVWTGAKYDFDGQICYCQHPWLLWLPNCHGDSVLRKICGDGIYNLITYHFFGSVMSQSHQPILAIYHAFIWIMQIYFTSLIQLNGWLHSLKVQWQQNLIIYEQKHGCAVNEEKNFSHFYVPGLPLTRSCMLQHI